MKKAVIYARYSCEKQTEQSIEGQLRVCHEFAEKNGYTVIHNYIDRAVSGKTDKREQFQQMLKDSADKSFEFVIVYKLDRFARNRYDSAINKATLKKNGVKVLSACEQITDTPEGIILEAMIRNIQCAYASENGRIEQHAKVFGSANCGRTSENNTSVKRSAYHCLFEKLYRNS